MTGRIKQAGPFAIGTVTLTLIAVLFALVITGAIHTLFGGPSTQTIHATFADAQQLKRGDPVRIHGVQVGKVDDISEDRRGPGATVTLDVKRSSGPVHADATATLKWRLLLGRSFYVALDPGTDKAGELRDQMIPMSQTGQQVELDQLSSVDGGAARRGLQTMPGELAKALADPQAPTRALDGLARVAPSLTRSLHAA
ncbi:MAG: Mammalian cell entry related domain protein, partial [Solirubrobacterales bacterium]|nr:Mammalian cell entry related domain protein [Solirubrobacterales bacterium]